MNEILEDIRRTNPRDFFKLKGDLIIWVIVFILFALSTLTVYSSTFSLAYKSGDINAMGFLIKHLKQIGMGLVIMIVVHNIHFKYFQKATFWVLLIAILLLGYTLVKGMALNQAARWISIAGIRFQTSEFAKIALLMFVAKQLNNNANFITNFKKGILPILIPIAVVCGLIISENLSTALLLALVCFTLMFIGRAKLLHLGLLGFGSLLMAFIVISVFLAYAPDTGRVSTWKNRIERFISSEDTEQNSKKDTGKSLQIKQSKIAIATGGLLGKGPGKSTQKYFLPHAYSDFIYSIICEEYGIWGGFGLLVLYLTMIFRLGVLVNNSSMQYPAYLAAGIILMFVLQAMVHMLVACDLMPVTGQTLPLVSWGGSSLLINSLGMGLVLSVCNTLKKQKQAQEEIEEEVIEID